MQGNEVKGNQIGKKDVLQMTGSCTEIILRNPIKKTLELMNKLRMAVGIRFHIQEKKVYFCKIGVKNLKIKIR
jgi:hypothetical protein